MSDRTDLELARVNQVFGPALTALMEVLHNNAPASFSRHLDKLIVSAFLPLEIQANHFSLLFSFLRKRPRFDLSGNDWADWANFPFIAGHSVSRLLGLINEDHLKTV